ncbi:3'-5' exonuclease [Streptomyces sp. NPDC001339]|uniref:3'-5' exonuclease n=1 Tax=Streptomyces sp. NPDC001339 TaxID=3364563 RepID=UPI0036CC3799
MQPDHRQQRAGRGPPGRGRLRTSSTHGTDATLAAVNHLTHEDQAQVTVSTAHKAKGREWPSARIASGFPPPRDSDQQDDSGQPIPGPIDDAEARLAYVAVTRTRNRLDIGGLAWIDQHPDGTLAANPPAPNL